MVNLPLNNKSVERLNLASKAPKVIAMTHAMVDVYRMHKAVIMEYQAAQEKELAQHTD